MKLVLLATLTAFYSLLICPASATITIIDDFNDGNNTGWTDSSPLAGFGASNTYSYPSGAYRLTVGASPNPSALGASRGGSLRSDATYTQFTSTVDVLEWDLAGANAMVVGMLGRLSAVGLGTTNGYGFFYDTLGNVTLAKITGEAPATLTASPLTLTSGTGYRFAFSGNGDSLTGEVFALSNLALPLVSIAAVDASYNSGYSGIFVYDGHSPATAANHATSATFDNYYSAVPEPAGSLWCLAGFGMGALRRRL